MDAGMNQALSAETLSVTGPTCSKRCCCCRRCPPAGRRRLLWYHLCPPVPAHLPTAAPVQAHRRVPQPLPASAAASPTHLQLYRRAGTPSLASPCSCPLSLAADSYVPKVFGFKIHSSAFEQQPKLRQQQRQQQQQQGEGSQQAVGNGTGEEQQQQQQVVAAAAAAVATVDGGPVVSKA